MTTTTKMSCVVFFLRSKNTPAFEESIRLLESEKVVGKQQTSSPSNERTYVIVVAASTSTAVNAGKGLTLYFGARFCNRFGRTLSFGWLWKGGLIAMWSGNVTRFDVLARARCNPVAS